MAGFLFSGSDIIVAIGADLIASVDQGLSSVIVDRGGAVVTMLAKRVRHKELTCDHESRQQNNR